MLQPADLDAKPLVEADQGESDELDPDAQEPKSRKLFTQPYDLNVKTLLSQIEESTLHLRPLSGKPKFQRRYVWPDQLASRLIESILLNVPIPPCYFAQNDDYEFEVIDGQQRIYSIFRFCDNQFKLSGLEALKDLNGRRFFELDSKTQNRITNFTLRCVVVTNDSDEELRFDVFERLNTNTVPLNAQELRNCVYRGELFEATSSLVEYAPWLQILRRRAPDKRMQDEELILRFFAFQRFGLQSYRTPQKYWLNDAAKQGRTLGEKEAGEFADLWKQTVDKCLIVFSPTECFRRIATEAKRSPPLNKALMDLTMHTLCNWTREQVEARRGEFRQTYSGLHKNAEFEDLISRSVDHKSRTLRRFEIWNEAIAKVA
jgi:hypothetical protein